MQIVTITGPAGSGKTHLARAAAETFGAKIYNARGLTDYAIDTYLRSAAQEPSTADNTLIFDEARGHRRGQLFRDYLLSNYDELDVRVVLIEEA